MVTTVRISIFLILLVINSQLWAHQAKPSIIDLTYYNDSTIGLKIATNIESLLAGIGPQHKDTDDAPEATHYKQLRELSTEQLEKQFLAFEPGYRNNLKLTLMGASKNEKVSWRFKRVEIPAIGDTRISRVSHIYYEAELLPGMEKSNWQYPEKYGDSVIRFMTEGGEEKTSYWLKEGKVSPDYPLSAEVVPQSWLETAIQYTVLGFEHILPKGLDHILFVLGLFLLSTRFKPLLWQVTAFTIAHSITLGMSIYGYISLPGSIVEPLIALSIAYVGIENILTKQLKPWRIVVVFLFGLLHGMGFASVLTELGLPESQFFNALVTFNIGVELGQLTVIAIAFLLVGWLSNRQQVYRYAVIIPGSLSIALMGLYWTFERV